MASLAGKMRLVIESGTSTTATLAAAAEPAGATLVRTVTTGMTSSCSVGPPWWKARSPPALNTVAPGGKTRSRSESYPNAVAVDANAPGGFEPPRPIQHSTVEVNLLSTGRVGAQ